MGTWVFQMSDPKTVIIHCWKWLATFKIAAFHLKNTWIINCLGNVKRKQALSTKNQRFESVSHAPSIQLNEHSTHTTTNSISITKHVFHKRIKPLSIQLVNRQAVCALLMGSAVNRQSVGLGMARPTPDQDVLGNVWRDWQPLNAGVLMPICQVQRIEEIVHAAHALFFLVVVKHLPILAVSLSEITTNEQCTAEWCRCFISCARDVRVYG